MVWARYGFFQPTVATFQPFLLPFRDIEPTDHGFRYGGRATSGRIVKPGKTNTIGSQLVKLGRFYFTSITPDIGITHVIGHDQYNIRTFIPGFFVTARRKGTNN